MSYRSVEEYDRECWGETVVKAVVKLFQNAESDQTWFPVVELPAYSHRIDLAEDGGVVREREHPASFTVRVSHVEFAADRDKTISRVANSILDHFMAERAWAYVVPRVQLRLYTGPYFELHVYDSGY